MELKFQKPHHYIIAEMSGNHNGDLNRALKLIELAKESVRVQLN